MKTQEYGASTVLRRLRRAFRGRTLIPDVNFITIHYAYFILTSLAAGLIIWGTATPFQSLSFIDSYFLAASAMTEAGLNTVNLSTLNTFQQVVLLLLIMLGSAIFVSAFIVIVRLKAFEKEFVNVIRSQSNSRLASLQGFPALRPQDVATRLSSIPNVSLPPTGGLLELPSRLPATAPSSLGDGQTLDHVYATHKNTVRSLMFASTDISDIDLTNAERERLGGAEDQAVLFLAYLVPIYFVMWQLRSTISCGWWIANHRASTTRANGLDPWWTGAFNAVSAFNNNGMSLLDANMTAFQDAYFLLITMGLLILAGNTAYPIFLRTIVWTIWKLLPHNMIDSKQTLRFLLDHPRRCYTNLFPSSHTWWLALALVVLNGIDWAAFEILNIGNKNITQLNGHNEVIDGLFQALAVRSGGFYVVPIPKIRISLQVFYVIMMYISVYPVVFSIRNSNVYEERTLGIFPNPDDIEILEEKSNNGQDAGRFTFFRVARSSRKPSLFIAVAILLIMIIEGSQFEADPVNFSVFNVIFEVVSGYGTVGISMGVPNNAYSFCGSWHTLSKLVLTAVMIKGRHRGLPMAIDRAVQLLGRQSDPDPRPCPQVDDGETS